MYSKDCSYRSKTASMIKTDFENSTLYFVFQLNTRRSLNVLSEENLPFTSWTKSLLWIYITAEVDIELTATLDG